MTQKQRRTWLYSVFAVAATGLLIAGFGITVPPDPGARLGGAPMLAGLGDFDGAIEICDQVISEHPDNIDARVYKATFLAQDKRFDDSLSMYDEAIALAKDGGKEPWLLRRLRTDRASVMLQAGRTADFDRERNSLAKDGADYCVHMLDGMRARKSGKWAEAELAFRRALKDEAESPSAKAFLIEVLTERGAAALSKGAYPDALGAYDAAFRVRPDRPDIGLKVAEVHLAMDHPVTALELLRELGVETPGVAPLVFRGATALLEAGRPSAAIVALRGAHSADPEGTETLLAKDPAWKDFRGKIAFDEPVSKQDGADESGLPGSEGAIASQETPVHEGSDEPKGR
ncbi:MAG: tetratricopeptide repeat protein [Planctomycetota bacterium]